MDKCEGVDVDASPDGFGLDHHARLCQGPLCLALGPVIPKHVVALCLVELYLRPEFGLDLLGIDTGQKGRELAHRHTKCALYATFRRCFDDRNTPPFIIGIEFDSL